MTLKEIITTLESLTKDFEPAYLYWVNAHPSAEKENDIRLSGTADSGEVYCEDCADKEVERMEALDPDGEYTTEGGQYYGAELSDNFEFCSKCDSILWVTLTAEGARTGLEGFQHWVGNLHSDPQSCYEFISICEAIEQADDDKEKESLTGQAIVVYHRMEQIMKLYQQFPPTEGLQVWVSDLGKDGKETERYLRVYAPYPVEDKPLNDHLFVSDVARLFGINIQEWRFKNTYPHIIEKPMYRLSEIKGVGQPSDEPLTHHEFLVALACFALADGRPGVPFCTDDILPFLEATGLNTMPLEEAKEVGDAIIRNEHYRQAMVQKLRQNQPIS